MYGLILLITALFALPPTQSEGQNPNSAMTAPETHTSVDSITMRYRNLEKYRSIVAGRNEFEVPHDELMRQYEQYAIGREDWDAVLDVLRTAEYQYGQYDSVINPGGFMRKATEPAYKITIHNADATTTTVLLWGHSGNLNINGRWYSQKSGDSVLRLNAMLQKYLAGDIKPPFVRYDRGDFVRLEVATYLGESDGFRFEITYVEGAPSRICDYGETPYFALNYGVRRTAYRGAATEYKYIADFIGNPDGRGSYLILETGSATSEYGLGAWDQPVRVFDDPDPQMPEKQMVGLSTDTKLRAVQALICLRELIQRDKGGHPIPESDIYRGAPVLPRNDKGAPEVPDKTRLAGEWTFDLSRDGCLSLFDEPGSDKWRERSFTFVSPGLFMEKAAGKPGNPPDGEGFSFRLHLLTDGTAELIWKNNDISPAGSQSDLFRITGGWDLTDDRLAISYADPEAYIDMMTGNATVTDKPNRRMTFRCSIYGHTLELIPEAYEITE